MEVLHRRIPANGIASTIGSIAGPACWNQFRLSENGIREHP